MCGKVPLPGIEPGPQPPQGCALSAELQGHQSGRVAESLFKQAGRQGFEPWVQFYPHNRLAGGSDRPLRHLPNRPAMKLEAEGEGFEPPMKLPS